jgi:hypothetical protein
MIQLEFDFHDDNNWHTWHDWRVVLPPKDVFVWVKYSKMETPQLAKTCKNGCCVDVGFGPMVLPNFWRATSSEEAMKAAHEVLSHTDWLREKLTMSASDTRPRVSHEQVMSEAQAIIDRKHQAHAGKTTT